MLIIQVILFLLSHENCGCYGNGNSQNGARVEDFCIVGNTCANFFGMNICILYLYKTGRLFIWAAETRRLKVKMFRVGLKMCSMFGR